MIEDLDMKFILVMLWLYSVSGAFMFAHEFAYEKAFREARQELEKNQGYRFQSVKRAFAGEVR